MPSMVTTIHTLQTLYNQKYAISIVTQLLYFW